MKQKLLFCTCLILSGTGAARADSLEPLFGDSSRAGKAKIEEPSEDSAPQVTRSRSAERFNGAANEKTVYVGDEPESHMLPPDQTPPVRVNKEAPGPFIAMKRAYDDGDMKTANAFADQYVRYMQRVMFEVRELSQMIGEALVRSKALEEDDWVGVSQLMSKEMAQARKDNPIAFKATPEMGLERIKADPKGEAEVYVFCSVATRYCREMGPDIERLWQIARRDSSVKFGVYLIGESQKDWIRDFRAHTGMTMPIQEGNDLAKAMRVSFVPAVVVRSPATKQSYLRTGLMNFTRLFEFVRAVQGKRPELMTAEMDLVNQPIGQREQATARGETLHGEELPTNMLSAAARQPAGAPERLQKF